MKDSNKLVCIIIGTLYPLYISRDPQILQIFHQNAKKNIICFNQHVVLRVSGFCYCNHDAIRYKVQYYKLQQLLYNVNKMLSPFS